MAAARQRHLQLWLHVQLPISNSITASARYDRHLKWEKKSEELKKSRSIACNANELRQLEVCWPAKLS